jgi:hypothetical protein
MASDLTPATYLYIVRMDVDDPANRLGFDRWYARQHAPDVVLGCPGFISATSYRSRIGTPWVCSFYEIDRLDLFETPEYAAVAPNDPELATVRTWLSGHTASIYAAKAACGQAAGGQPGSLVASPWVTTLRYDAEADAAEAIAKAVATAGSSDILSGYAGTRTLTHPRTPCRDGEHVVVVAWTSSTPFSLDAAGVLRALGAPADVLDLATVELNHVERVYELRRSPAA